MALTKRLGILTAILVGALGCSGDPKNTGEGGHAGHGGGGDGGAGAGHSGGGGSGGSEPVIPADHPRIYLNEANRARLSASLTAEDKAAVRFRDMVDNQLAGADIYAFEPHFAAMLGVLTSESGYCDYAVTTTDEHVAAEEALIASGQNAEVAYDSYLYVGDAIGDLAMVYDWCYASLTEDQKSRWIAYANQAVWNVWHPEEAVWAGASYPWSGWSIDNPSNNYYYSFLQATMLLGLASFGENDQAQTWIDKFRQEKIQDQLVPTFEQDLPGGGSREGTGYGTAMMRLFHLYDLWESTTGERIWDLTGHTRASLVNAIHFTVPTLDRIAPIGDHARDSTASLFDYHRSYVLVLQSLLGKDDPLTDVAQTWLEDCSVPEMGQQFMFIDDFLYANPSHAKAPLSDLYPTYYAPGTGNMFFRNSWQTSATWGAFIAGPFTESHAHRDQGSLLVYRGSWLGYDQNIFSHSGIYQNEEAHNLVRIVDGSATVPQMNGASALLSLHDTEALLYLRADITPIYGDNTAVVHVDREVLFLKGPGAFVVMDRAFTAGGAEAVWQLNAPVAPAASGGGWVVNGSGGTLGVTPLLPGASSGEVLNWMNLDTDMEGGFRLDVFNNDVPGQARFLMLLADPDTVSDATPTNGAGTVGASLTFSDGTTAEVSFQEDIPGGTLKLVSGGATVFDGDLPEGIDTLPLFANP